MTTSTRIAGVGTILFDVGNTLAFVDLERVGNVLAEGGRAVTPDRLEAAEGAARRVMYAHAAEHPAGRDEAQTIRDRLTAAHRDANLWTRVPAGTAGVLDELARRGFRLGVVSNSDGRVPELLATIGLAERFETVIDSTLVGVEKPDPRIFEIALERMGERPEAAVYVGDFPAVDVEGARRAGLRPVLLDPSGSLDSRDAPSIASLDELPALLA